MSIFVLLVLVLFWSAVVAIPCLFAYNAAMTGDTFLAASILFVALVLGASVAGGMSAVFGWEGTSKQSISAKGVEAMKNIIVKRKMDGEIAVVVHWDHFHVNRFSGKTINKAFTVKVLSGEREGNSYVWPVNLLHSCFEVVGTMSEEEATKAL